MDYDVELGAIAAGDPSAFGRWVAGVEHEVRVSLASFATSVDTEAVLQEVLLRMWQVAPRFTPDGRPNALMRLAIKSARNLAIDHTRRNGRRVPSVDLSEAAEAAVAANESQPDALLGEAIGTCREALPPKPRAALGARIEDGGALHDRDLASRLGMKLNTFLKNVGRARALLEACLRHRGIRIEEHLGSSYGAGDITS